MEEVKNCWEEAAEKEKEKENESKEKALDMRKKATESLSETQKRKRLESEESTPAKRRRSGDAVGILRECMQLKKQQGEMESQRIGMEQEKANKNWLSSSKNLWQTCKHSNSNFYCK
eukprot:gene16373-biopygen12065